MSFSAQTREDALIACGRCCSICHNFCSTKIELHHIKQQADGGDDSFENCIPLCFNCHADVKAYDPHHPKGTKYTESELRRHRDNWYQKMSQPRPAYQDEEFKSLDTAVFHRLFVYLPYDVMRNLRDMNFDGWVFEYDYFLPLRKFIEHCKWPNNEFFSSDLESAKASLSESIRTFFNKSLPYIFSLDNDTTHCHIPPDWLYNPKSEQVYLEAVNTLNDAATEIWEKYAGFIRACRFSLRLDLNLDCDL